SAVSAPTGVCHAPTNSERSTRTSCGAVMPIRTRLPLTSTRVMVMLSPMITCSPSFLLRTNMLILLAIDLHDSADAVEAAKRMPESLRRFRIAYFRKAGQPWGHRILERRPFGVRSFPTVSDFRPTNCDGSDRLFRLGGR